MDIKEYIKKYNLPFNKIKDDYATDFDSLYKDEKEWLSNLEDKIHLLKNVQSEQAIREVIKKLKNNTSFDENDTTILSVFVSKINNIVSIANRINNFKEGTALTNGNTLKLSDFFNTVALSNSLKTCMINLNDNLNNFLPHIYSVIKHCQSPNSYPIYYKYWKNILREVLSKEDDYDSMCSFYSSFPNENRHLSFGSYLGTIGIQIAKNISQLGVKISKDSKEYKYLTTDVINIERYKSILDDSIGLTKQYFLVGAYWDSNDPADQSTRFIENGIWENGYDDKFIDDVKAVTVGSKIAIKSVFTREKTKSVMAIKARGKVLENNNDGKTLIVEWEENFTPFEVDFSGGYWATIKEVTNKEHIKAIFYNNINKMNYKTIYLDWLTKQNFVDSGKPSSYIRAIEILSDILKSNLFEEDNQAKLNSLYTDLVAEQKKDNSKYYYENAPSYGKSGFYSASIAAYIEFLNGITSSSMVSEQVIPLKTRVKNKFGQAICVIGESGVGKTYRVNKTLENENHKAVFIIIDNMWQHILFDYSPIDRKYYLTKVGEFIKKAFNDVENNYTIVIDECHKNLEIINDVLLQAISTKRNDGVRFLALNSLVDKEFDFLPAINGNRVLPSNLGFLFISSKSGIIEGNDDLKNRIEIIELIEGDQENNDYTIDYLLSKIKKEEPSEYSN